MIFRQVEAIYYTQKRISDGRVWTEEEVGGVDRIPFLESWTNAGTPGLLGSAGFCVCLQVSLRGCLQLFWAATNQGLQERAGLPVPLSDHPLI